MRKVDPVPPQFRLMFQSDERSPNVARLVAGDRERGLLQPTTLVTARNILPLWNLRDPNIEVLGSRKKVAEFQNAPHVSALEQGSLFTILITVVVSFVQRVRDMIPQVPPVLVDVFAGVALTAIAVNSMTMQFLDTPQMYKFGGKRMFSTLYYGQQQSGRTYMDARPFLFEKIREHVFGSPTMFRGALSVRWLRMHVPAFVVKAHVDQLPPNWVLALYTPIFSMKQLHHYIRVDLSRCLIVCQEFIIEHDAFPNIPLRTTDPDSLQYFSSVDSKWVPATAISLGDSGPLYRDDVAFDERAFPTIARERDAWMNIVIRFAVVVSLITTFTMQLIPSEYRDVWFVKTIARITITAGLYFLRI